MIYNNKLMQFNSLYIIINTYQQQLFPIRRPTCQKVSPGNVQVRIIHIEVKVLLNPLITYFFLLPEALNRCIL